MDPSKGAPELRFEPPGPGSWELDPVHFPRPVTRYWAETHPEPFRRGVRDFTRFYGMLIDTLDYELRQRLRATRRAPGCAGGDSGSDSSGRRKSSRRSSGASSSATGTRPSSRPRSGAPRDAGGRSRRALRRGAGRLPDALPRSPRRDDLPAHAPHRRRPSSRPATSSPMWATGPGFRRPNCSSLMRGAAPVSAGASAELERLIAAIGEDPRAQELLASKDDPGARARGACARWTGRPARRCPPISTSSATGCSTASTSASRARSSCPDVLLRAIRVARRGAEQRRRPTSRQRIADVRAKVPEEHRAEFDELLGEARLTYRIRDERGVFSDIWASGLMRRAVLAAGRRLAAKGRIHDAEHFVDAGFDEMCALLSGAGGAVRGRARGARRIPRDAQRQGRPAAARRSAVSAAGPCPGCRRGRAGDAGDRHRPGRAVRQLARRSTRSRCCAGWRRAGASTKARRGGSPVPPSSIGSSRATSSSPSRRREAFNILLPLLGAIVTDSGGLLSHSAIVAREYGIPGVVGTRDGDRAHRRRGAGAGRRRRRRGDGARVTRGRPAREARTTLAVRLEGGRARAGASRRPAGAARRRALRRDRRGRRRRRGGGDRRGRRRRSRPLGGPLAVRSSAVDEDGADASFAGQHLTLLNVPSVGRARRRR